MSPGLLSVVKLIMGWVITGLAASTAAGAPQEPVRILFVGNSFTFGHANPVSTFNHDSITDLNGLAYGGVPAVFKEMTLASGLNYDVSIETEGGKTLAYHVATKADIVSRAGWDIVVLQEQSTEPLPKTRGGNLESFATAAAQLGKLVRSKNEGAKIFMYETWSSPSAIATAHYPAGLDGLRAMQKDLQQATFAVCRDNSFAGVARAGDAFIQAIEKGVAAPEPLTDESKKIELWDKHDHRHAGPYGFYLSAAVLYAKITGNDPRQLPNSSKAATAFGITPDRITELHQIAYEISELPDP